MADQITLQEIFEKMEINVEKVPLLLAEEWINSCSEVYFKDVKYGKFAFTAKYLKSPWHQKTGPERGNLLIQFSQKLKQKEELLIQLLCYAAYNYLDAKKIINQLQIQFTYFARYCFLLEDSNNAKSVVDFHPVDFDVPIFGQIVAPILASGFTVRIHPSIEFCHFYLILAELLEDSGLPLGVFTLSDHQETTDEKISIRNPYPDFFCPLIVFEDADIDSAVESIVQGAWRFLGKMSWSISHVYIQESVFVEVVNKLKSRSLTLRPGSRFLKSCDITEEANFELKRMANLEVFQPFKSCPQCFYIGWDPSDLGELPTDINQPNLGIPLLPFRKQSEAIALANKSRFGCCVSLWTERINTAKKVSKMMEFGTVWINCHGLLHPSIPFESKKESKYPINGKPLIRALNNVCLENAPDEGMNSFSWEKVQNDISASLCVSKDIYSAIEKSRNSQQIWIKFDQEDLFQKLCDILTTVESIIQSEIKQELVKAIKYTVYNARFSEHSFAENLEKMDVTYSFQPFGVIWIILSNISPLIFEQLVILIFCLLAYGNSVIISARTDELKRIALHVCGIFEKCKLQNGLLCFVTEPFDPQKLYEKGSNEYRYCKIINRYITFGKSSFIFPLGQNVEFCQEGLEFYKNSQLLKFLAVQRKSVWVPNP